MSVRGILKRLGVGIGLAALVLGMQGPASASASAAGELQWCRVAGTHCTSAAVQAHAEHWIWYEIITSPFCGADFTVYDAANGATVGKGFVGSGHKRSGRIFGLYGFYKVRVYNTCFDTYGGIANR